MSQFFAIFFIDGFLSITFCIIVLSTLYTIFYGIECLFPAKQYRETN